MKGSVCRIEADDIRICDNMTIRNCVCEKPIGYPLATDPHQKARTSDVYTFLGLMRGSIEIDNTVQKIIRKARHTRIPHRKRRVYKAPITTDTNSHNHWENPCVPATTVSCCNGIILHPPKKNILRTENKWCTVPA
jgi:hypothetical protein